MQFSPWRLALSIFDAVITAVAFFIGVTLYYSGGVPPQVWGALRIILPLTMFLIVTSNCIFGLYNRVWKYAGIETATAIGLSTTLALGTAFLVSRWVTTPISVVVWYTTWLCSLFAMAGSRFFWRIIRPGTGKTRTTDASQPKPTRVLIYGAGFRGCTVGRMINHQVGTNYCVVGFVDDNPAKHLLFVGEYRVLGNGNDLPRLVDQYQIDEIIVAIPSLSKTQLQGILLHCREAKVKAKVLPSLLELTDGQYLRLREINVDDLLGREAPLTQVDLHQNYLSDKTILVTGAGGSIGSELSRQICRHNPKHLLLLGRGENRIHWIYLQLQERYPNLRITPIIHNITVTDSIESVFAQYRPEIVFHAAAHKHVYLMEAVPAEAVRNNVLATRDLARLASEYQVEKFIFISTDKAVSPTSVMGATKRACELLLINRPRTKTEYICVRFGNVLGSEGSVLEIFKRQWKNGEPLTVTHPDATRFFMSIPEASFLVLQAGALGKHGNIFLLDMGDPVQIKKLAEEFILLHGGNPHDPNAIKVTGLRKGEKLHEVLAYDTESLNSTANPHVIKISNASGDLTYEAIEKHLQALTTAVKADDDAEALRILAELTGGSLKQHQRFVLSKVI